MISSLVKMEHDPTLGHWESPDLADQVIWAKSAKTGSIMGEDGGGGAEFGRLYYLAS